MAAIPPLVKPTPLISHVVSVSRPSQPLYDRSSPSYSDLPHRGWSGHVGLLAALAPAGAPGSWGVAWGSECQA